MQRAATPPGGGNQLRSGENRGIGNRDRWKEIRMKTIRSKAQRPLKVHLSQDKVLHLGPGNEGQISTHDLDRKAVQHLLAEGQIEIVSDGESFTTIEVTGQVHADTHGHHPDLSVKKRGER
jgi:hypothetical protein